MDELLDFFAENGYAVVSGALTAAEVAAINDGIAADCAAHPEHWEPGPRPGHIAVGCDAPELLLRTEALDGLVCHPSVMPLVRRILGVGVQMSGLSFMRREPCAVDPPADIDGGDPLCLTRMWHREDRGTVEGADGNEYFVPALQVIYYLDDVDAESHCFSIIPESAATKRALPTTAQAPLRIDDAATAYVDPEKPRWLDAFGRETPRRTGRVDIYAGAGAAIVFNNASYHAGTVRQTERQRRTVHVRYRQPEPMASRHALKEPWQCVADFNAALPDRLK